MTVPTYDHAELSVVFQDAEQESAPTKLRIRVDDTSTISQLRTILTAWCDLIATLSQASVKYCDLSLRHIGTYVPNDPSTMTRTIEDKAALYFISDVTGGKTSLQVPAPIDDIFLTDGETVNKLQTQVALVVTYIQNEGLTIGLDGTLKYQLGYRLRRKGKKEGAGKFKAIG